MGPIRLLRWLHSNLKYIHFYAVNQLTSESTFVAPPALPWGAVADSSREAEKREPEHGGRSGRIELLVALLGLMLPLPASFGVIVPTPCAVRWRARSPAFDGMAAGWALKPYLLGIPAGW
jgi:hypothetical protein